MVLFQHTSYWMGTNPTYPMWMATSEWYPFKICM